MGVALAPAASCCSAPVDGRRPGREAGLGWALASLALQGVGASIAKLVVTRAAPSASLLMSASVHVVVGLVLAPPSVWSGRDLRGWAALFTIVAYAVAAVATIRYLLALASGPAAVVVPLVATSPALTGILGIAFLKEEGGPRRTAESGSLLRELFSSRRMTAANGRGVELDRRPLSAYNLLIV